MIEMTGRTMPGKNVVGPAGRFTVSIAETAGVFA